MTEMQKYQLWCDKNLEDKDVVADLEQIKGNQEEIYDRFYRELEFGTAGLRGVLGAGTNRMNIYTVRKATQGFANYLIKNNKSKGIAIAYDSRIKSDVFAKEAACVLAANGIKVYLYKELMPTPALSFAVRDLHCDAGIVVTASHNPAKYNGYKVYGSDGCQLDVEDANQVLAEIVKLDIFSDIKLIGFESAMSTNLIEYIGEDLIDRFIEAVKAQEIVPGACAKANLKVVYTPLNGAGNRCVREILKRIGVSDVTVVKSQEMPDGNFPTCPYPNPEIREALNEGLKVCEEVGPDLLLATDPDCDRVGIAVKDGDDYRLFTGNEVGALLLEFICKVRTVNGTMPKNPIAVKSFVSTSIVEKIAAEYGVQVINVLTGFKYIGQQILALEKKCEQDRFILGFEESYGYLSGSYVRDKDAVNGSMLICEMAAYYKLQGMTLVDAVNKLYDKYGKYLHKIGNFACEGAAGMERMKQIMADLRANVPAEIGGYEVVWFSDYASSVKKNLKTGEEVAITLPKSDVLAYDLTDNLGVIVRPSGTEPKIKVYYTAVGSTWEEAEEKQAKMAADMNKMMGF